MNVNLPISHKLIQQVNYRGAAVIRGLSESTLCEIREEAKGYQYRDLQMYTKTGVHQRARAAINVSQHGACARLGKYFEEQFSPLCLNGGYSSEPIVFNDYALQRYPLSPLDEPYAIAPHRDYANCINLIIVCVIEGTAPFYLLKDKNSKEGELLSSSVGDVIIMRGNGFAGNPSRPVHAVGRVSEERLTIGYRQAIKEGIPKTYE